MRDKKRQIRDRRCEQSRCSYPLSHIPYLKFKSPISYLKSGYTLVEIMIAMVVLVLGLIPLVKLIGDSLIATTDLGSRSVANQLTQDLMEEIKQRKWDEDAQANGFTPGTPSVIGLDGGGETLADKTTLDDIDDYNNLSNTPPRNASNEVLSQYGKYTRSVTVQYMEFNDLGGGTGEFEVAGAPPTDYKQITVTVRWTSGSGKGRDVTHSTIMSNIARR